MRLMKLTGVLFFFLCLAACRERDKHGNPVDEPTAGVITLSADESLRPLVEAEVSAFMAIYHDAQLKVRYVSEQEAIEAFLQDSARLVLVTRELTESEKKILLRDNLEPIQTGVATGAVALIINRSNADSLLRLAQLQSIIEGKTSDWNQLNHLRASSPIEVIFDNPTSGIVRLVQDSVVHVKKLPPNFFAVTTNQEVVNYVSRKPNAIGLIGVEWISDRDDSTTHDFLHTIRVMSLARDTAFCKPYQAYIALNQYPLCRKIFIISREARAGLGSGFTAFVASDKGQRIVLKAGLVPATMPVRIVEVNRNQ